MLLFFQHLDDDRDSGSEEMQVSSTDLFLETSEMVSFIITSTYSAVIVKLSNFGDGRHILYQTIDLRPIDTSDNVSMQLDFITLFMSS